MANETLNETAKVEATVAKIARISLKTKLARVKPMPKYIKTTPTKSPFFRRNKPMAVSTIVRKFNYLTDMGHHMPCTCVCLFRLCTGKSSTEECPVHFGVNKNKNLIDRIMHNFIEKKIQYIQTTHNTTESIVKCENIKLLLPVVVYLRQHKKAFHLSTVLPVERLNRKQVAFTNLFILSIGACSWRTKDCCRFNRLIKPDKVIEFRCMIIINCNQNRPQQYIEILDNGNFNFHIGRLLHDSINSD